MDRQQCAPSTRCVKSGPRASEAGPAGGRVPRRFERGGQGRRGLVLGWVGCMLGLALTLPAGGQPTFTCELPGQGVRVERVLGGRGVTHEMFPWQVAVLNRVSPGRVVLCGGSLIEREWVLTAAHCVTRGASATLWPRQQFEVRHGATNWRESDEATASGVAEIHMHPGYDGDVTRGNDIALLRLSRPIEDTRYAVLPKEDAAAQFVIPGACSVVTGWGHTREGDDSSGADQLQAASLAILDQRECRQAYGASRISAGEVCAGLPGGGRDSCQGDSGGPLVVEGLGPGHHVLAGVVSWGEGCGRAGKPGVYARVAHYMPWIRRVTGGG